MSETKREVDITQVVKNPKNPRVIKDDKFNILCRQIEEFPEMMEKRPLVVITNKDGKYEVLGGNMRLAAHKHLKKKKVWIDCADEWTQEKRDKFLILDNLSYGEWDWDGLANGWDTEQLQSMGMDIPGVESFAHVQQIEQNQEKDYDEEEEIKVHASLSDKFIVPPFSVFDTKQGYWQSRKAEWKSLGIKSEIGRAGNLLGYSETILSASNPKKQLAEVLKGSSPNTANIESKIPNYYAKKESGLTDAEIIKEFIETSDLSGTSVFDPVLCEISYKWFCIPEGKVLDPFAGGSVRGIVASKVGLNYTGIDLRAEQVAANMEQVKEICSDADGKVQYLVGSSENVESLTQDKYDLIFTCPPYYDLEQYSDNPQDLSTMSYEEFDRAYDKIIQKCVEMLVEDSFSVFVVGDVRDKNGMYLDIVGKTIAAHKKAGAELYNSAILLESVGTAGLRAARIFNGGRKLTKVHQNVLVFYKGNVSNIKGKFVAAISEEPQYEESATITEYGEKVILPVEI